MASGGRVFNYGVSGQYATFSGAAFEVTTGTIAGWIKNLDEGNSGAFIGCNNAGTFAGYIFAWESGGFDQRFTFFDGTGWNFSNSIGAATALAAGWHHVAVRWVGTGSRSGEFFLDGVSIGTFTPAAMGVAGGGTKNLNNYPGGGNGVGVEYSEWAIFGSSLSNGNITTLNGGASPKTLTPIEHWRFNQAGATITGQMGYANLTLINAPGTSADGPTVADPPASATRHRAHGILLG